MVRNEKVRSHGGKEGNRTENFTSLLWLERKNTWVRERERGMQIRYPETFRYKISVREQDFCHYLSRVAKMELKLHLKLLMPFKKLLTFGL